MPFSQTHLAAACHLLAESALQERLPWLNRPAARAAYLLGSIGPDARVMAGVSREATHFYPIPRQDARPIQQIVFEQCPALRDSRGLRPDHAAFVGGYLTHLIMDVAWLDRVVMPYLYDDSHRWGAGHPNWRLYILLMARLEWEGAQALDPAVGAELETAHPQNWIAPLSDQSLVRWRDHISRLIAQGEPAFILGLLADMSGVPYPELHEAISTEAGMEAAAYGVVPRAAMDSFYAESAALSRNFLLDYLSPVHPEG